MIGQHARTPRALEREQRFQHHCVAVGSAGGGLGGLAIGAATFNLFMYIGFGLLMATSPSVAHAYGANDTYKVTAYARQSWWLVLALSILLFIGLRQADWFLPAIGIAEDVLPVSVGYIHAISWGMPGLLAFLAKRKPTWEHR